MSSTLCALNSPPPPSRSTGISPEKFHTDDVALRRSHLVSEWLFRAFNFRAKGMTNKRHYSYLRTASSSAWSPASGFIYIRAEEEWPVYSTCTFRQMSLYGLVTYLCLQFFVVRDSFCCGSEHKSELHKRPGVCRKDG